MYSEREADDLSEKLYTEYGPRLRAFAQRRLRDAAAAEDASQETLRRALIALREGRVQNLNAVPAFLFETAKHVCQHYQRSAGRQAHALERFAHHPAAPPTNDPADRLHDAQRHRAVRLALKRLNAPDRDLLLWSYRDGLDTQAIAARLSIESGTVRVRRHRALQRLREAIRVTLIDDRQP